MKYDNEKERRQMIAAGERALQSLRNAQNELNSAKNWGIADIIGGGFFTTMIKRSKMSRAQQYMEQAKADLSAFRRDLRELNAPAHLNVRTGDFLTFADYFFDGIVADWLVQDKISQARQQTADAINRVETILAQLR